MALEADNALLRQQIARLERGARACEVICRRPVISKVRYEPRRLFFSSLLFVGAAPPLLSLSDTQPEVEPEGAW